MSGSTLATTRRFLHGAAELLLAGPQYRASGRIELRVVNRGFATVATPTLKIAGDELITDSGRVGLQGRTYADVAASAGIVAGAPAGVYDGGSRVRPDDVVTLDAGCLAAVLRAFEVGEAALLTFAPTAERVLWPEHFDVAITVDQVNYGVSPGDGHMAEPYAYVGPHEWRPGRFWNMSFGAARSLKELGDTAAVTQFFHTGQKLAH